MATVIDALLITLNLDPSGFKKGTKETDEALKKTSAESTKTSKSMEAWGKNAASSLSKLRNEALGLLAVFTAGMGIKSFIGDTFKQSASLGRLSENLGMSAKDLAEWQLANKNAGGTVEGMTAQLEAANHAVAAYHAGVADAGTVNAAFYGKIHDEDMKDATTYMAALSRTISKFKGDAAKQSFVAGEIGVSKDTFNLMKQTTEEVQSQRMQFELLADQMAQAAGPAEEMRKKIDGLGDSFSASGMKILGKFVPAMEAALGVLKKVADALNDDEFVGEATARIFAFFGNKEAQDALKANKKDYKTLYSHDGDSKGRQVGNIRNEDVTSTPVGKASTPINKNLPRGIRNNNPGNLNFAGQKGATKETGPGGRFAVFGSMGEGVAALENQLKLYAARGIDSITAIVKKYAPASENNVDAYVKSLSKATGKGSSEKLDLNDAQTLHALVNGIIAHENGSSAINTVNMVQAARPQARSGNSTSTSSSETNINGPITIQTQATDAKGIARDLGKAISSTSFASQANTGLS